MKFKLAILFGAVAGALTFGTAAAARTPVIPGATCSNVGQLGTHGGQTYRCEQRYPETCPHFH